MGYAATYDGGRRPNYERKEGRRMRYEGLKDILDLAVRLQGAYGGLTLDDIQAEFFDQPAHRRAPAGCRRGGLRAAGMLGPGRREAALAVAFGTPCAGSSPSRRKNWWGSKPPPRPWTGAPASASARPCSASWPPSCKPLCAPIRRRGWNPNSKCWCRPRAWRCAPGPERERLDQGLLALLREAITTCRVVEYRYFGPIDEGEQLAAGSALRPALREPHPLGGEERAGR